MEKMSDLREQTEPVRLPHLRELITDKSEASCLLNFIPTSVTFHLTALWHLAVHFEVSRYNKQS